MTDTPHITFRAVEETPAHLRRWDGTIFPIRDDHHQILPAPGAHGWLCGRYGVMRDGLVWEMLPEPPPTVDSGPEWARALATQLEEIKRILQERS